MVSTPPEREGSESVKVLPAGIRSMAIDGHKFNPTERDRPRMLLDSAEEWALYNTASMLWGNTDESGGTGGENPTQPGYSQPSYQYKGHFVSYPLSRAAGQGYFDDNSRFQIVTRGVDHPFHMHQNPFWVMSIEIPDENGELHNILDAPRWQDVIWIPRHTGRVVFRSLPRLRGHLCQPLSSCCFTRTLACCRSWRLRPSPTRATTSPRTASPRRG